MSNGFTTKENNLNQVYTQDVKAGLSTYMNKVFIKMCIGLLVTFATSTAVANSGIIYGLPGSMFKAILLFQLVVVFVMSLGVNKLSAPALNVCFVVYSLLTGVTFGVITSIFAAETVIQAFVATAAVFGGLAITGYVTKKDLSGIGSIALAGLVAIILLSIVNIFFFKSDSLDLALDIFAVIVFCGLTMYDVQKIKRIYLFSAQQSGYFYMSDANANEFLSKLSIMGAFTLYLDFINLFLRLLSIFSRNRK
jgi:FtsH-binding integral membrane protein